MEAAAEDSSAPQFVIADYKLPRWRCPIHGGDVADMSIIDNERSDHFCMVCFVALLDTYCKRVERIEE